MGPLFLKRTWGYYLAWLEHLHFYFPDATFFDLCILSFVLVLFEFVVVVIAEEISEWWKKKFTLLSWNPGGSFVSEKNVGLLLGMIRTSTFLLSWRDHLWCFYFCLFVVLHLHPKSHTTKHNSPKPLPTPPLPSKIPTHNSLFWATKVTTEIPRLNSEISLDPKLVCSWWHQCSLFRRVKSC